MVSAISITNNEPIILGPLTIVLSISMIKDFFEVINLFMCRIIRDINLTMKKIQKKFKLLPNSALCHHLGKIYMWGML